MQKITTSIIPEKQTVATVKGVPESIDLKAICVFVATGFFLDDDTYWEDERCLQPASTHQLDANGITNGRLRLAGNAGHFLGYAVTAHVECRHGLDRRHCA